MKKCFVEKVWLEDEGRKIFPDLYEAVYLASDVDARIAQLEKALRDLTDCIQAHEIESLSCDRDGETHCECLRNMASQVKSLMERGAK